MADKGEFQENKRSSIQDTKHVQPLLLKTDNYDRSDLVDGKYSSSIVNVYKPCSIVQLKLLNVLSNETKFENKTTPCHYFKDSNL